MTTTITTKGGETTEEVSVFNGVTIVVLCRTLGMDVIQLARFIRADYTSVKEAKRKSKELILYWMEKKFRRRLDRSGFDVQTLQNRQGRIINLTLTYR